MSNDCERFSRLASRAENTLVRSISSEINEKLANAVARLRPRLLLLDPFVRLHRIDENNAGVVSALLAYLRTLERQEHVAIVVVHHPRKNGPSGAQAGLGLRGSGDLHVGGTTTTHHNARIVHQADQIPVAAAMGLDPTPPARAPPRQADFAWNQPA